MNINKARCLIHETLIDFMCAPNDSNFQKWKNRLREALTELDFKYHKGDLVKYPDENRLLQQGYIVGYKITSHCYLEKLIIYAVLEENHYRDVINSINNNETPFSYPLHWIKEEDIVRYE